MTTGEHYPAEKGHCHDALTQASDYHNLALCCFSHMKCVETRYDWCICNHEFATSQITNRYDKYTGTCFPVCYQPVLIVFSAVQTSVQVPSPAAGVIEELLVPDGGKVEGGTPLFKLRKGGLSYLACTGVT